MDPNATIQLCIDAAEAGDRQAFVEHMADYKVWLSNGGFAADDELLRQAAHRLADRLLFESMRILRLNRLPILPETVGPLSIEMALQLAQLLDEEMTVRANPIPDTPEGIIV